MTEFEQAEDAASRHRALYGDDVIRHDAEDYGDFLACEDCGWTVGYIPDGDWEPTDTPGETSVGH